MTLEELQKLAKELQESVKNLEAKNAELLDEKKKAAKKAEEEERARKKAEEERDEATAEAEAEKARKEGDWKKLEEQIKAKHAKELKELRDENEALKSARDKLVIDNELSSQLDAAGVKPEFKEAARALLRTKKAEASINSDGEFVGTIDGKPISEAVAEWAKSDAGKHFVGNANSGGGADGGGKSKKVTANPWAKDSFNLTEQLRITKEDPTTAKRLQAEAA